MGFDYCYDKTFFDRLKEPAELSDHFQADLKFLSRTARFLENHDESRVAARLPLEQHMAAAAIIAMGPGMRFWHMGQWEGHRLKIPVQLSRGPVESCACIRCTRGGNCTCIREFYEDLLLRSNLPVFKEGNWRSIINSNAQSVLVWEWTLGIEHAIVIVNYSSEEKSIDMTELVGYPVDQGRAVLKPWGLLVLQK